MTQRTLSIPDAVRAACFKTSSCSADAVLSALEWYQENHGMIPGAPAPEATSVSDAAALMMASAFDLQTHRNWSGILSVVRENVKREGERLDPFLPIWYAKTDTRKTSWLESFNGSEDTEGIQGRLNAVLTRCAPLRNRPTLDRLDVPPINDPLVMDDIAYCIRKAAKLFIFDYGESDEDIEFRWGESLCLLAGLSLSWVRAVAAGIKDESAWDAWKYAEDSELTKSIERAREITGFPLGLLRTEWNQLWPVIEPLSFGGKAPRWATACMALQLFKHARLWRGSTYSSIFVCFRGARAEFRLESDQLGMPLSALGNRRLAIDLLQVLGLPAQGDGQAWYEKAIGHVLKMICPDMLIEGRPTDDLYNVLIPPSVTFEQPKERNSIYRWIDSGIVIPNVAILDEKTGRVDKDAVIEGSRSLYYQWSVQALSQSALDAWRAKVPDYVTARSGASMILEKVLNVCLFDHKDGIIALLDCILTASIFRNEMVRSRLGQSATKEFPFIFALANSADADETTNQGKTSFCSLIMGVMEASTIGVKEVVQSFNANTSAPAQRAMATPLFRFGTAIFDEFVRPASNDHFLSDSGLFSYAMGNGPSPGQVRENGATLALKYPLMFTAKVLDARADMYNRVVPFFLDVIKDEALITSSLALQEYSAGSLAMEIRLSHIMWVRKNRFLDKLRALPDVKTIPWRFPAHAALLHVMGNVDKALDYMAFADARMKQLASESHATGLSDEMGNPNRFEADWFVKEASRATMEGLVMGGGDIDLGAFVRLIIEDGGRRQFSQVCAQGKIGERKVDMLFRKWIKAHGKSAYGYSFQLCADESSRPNRVVKVKKLKG
jgi:hypothetical protein